MKKLFFLILFFISIQSFGQRFPSVDSLQNYILRYVRNSTVETFTNLRMQNVVYGLSELLESRAVDSIWRVIGKDSIFFRKNGTTFAIKDSTGGIYTAGNGLTLSGSQFKLGGTLSDAATEVIAPFTKELYFKAYGAGGGLGNIDNRSELSIYNGGLNLYQYNSGSVEGGIEINSGGLSIFKTGGALNLGSNSQIFLKNGSSGVYAQTTTDTTNFKPLVLNTSTGLVSRLTSWPTFNLQQVTDNGNTTTNKLSITRDDDYIIEGKIGSDVITGIYQSSGDNEAYFRVKSPLSLTQESLYGPNIVIHKQGSNFLTVRPKATITGNNVLEYPLKTGTIPFSVRLNGTTYTSNDTGSIELGTITGGISDTSRIVTTDKTQSITGRKTFNAATFINKDSLPITTGKIWYAVIDTTTGQLQRQQVTTTASEDFITQRRKELFDYTDFLYGANYSNNVNISGTNLHTYIAGTGVSTTSTSYVKDGTLRLSTGSGSTDYSAFASQNGVFPYYLSSTDTLILEVNARITNASSSGQAYYTYIGFTNATSFTTSYTNNIGMLYDNQGSSTGSASSNNWQTVTCSASSRTWNTSSTSVITDGSTWVRYTIKALTGRVEYFVNGVSIQVHTTNIPTSSIALTPMVFIRKTAGTVSGFVDVDYYVLTKKYSTPR
jgi:hypothetical protein